MQEDDGLVGKRGEARVDACDDIAHSALCFVFLRGTESYLDQDDLDGL